MKFTTPFNRTQKSIRDCNVVEFKSPSMVKQSLAYATDINQIYQQYVRTGRLPLNGQQPIYDENFVKYDSLIEAQKVIGQASEYFAGLPAKIKNQYGNSLEKFILALNNKDEFLVKEGLLQLPTSERTIEPLKPVDDNTSVNPETPVKTDVETPVKTDVNTATTD